MSTAVFGLRVPLNEPKLKTTCAVLLKELFFCRLCVQCVVGSDRKSDEATSSSGASPLGMSLFGLPSPSDE